MIVLIIDNFGSRVRDGCYCWWNSVLKIWGDRIRSKPSGNEVGAIDRSDIIVGGGGVVVVVGDLSNMGGDDGGGRGCLSPWRCKGGC